VLSCRIRLYYHLKRFFPRRAQIALRRRVVMRKRKTCGSTWPINALAGKCPQGWTTWPERKKFAFVLTHDVETRQGHDRCLQLAELEERLGFRSAFNFVVDEYAVDCKLREELARRGFEIGVHGLTHDGSLFHSREEFRRQAVRLNRILKDWRAVGFRAPCMYHNLDWMHDLDIEYDASTFDTDPFEPQPDGLNTIFPLHIPGYCSEKSYVELPYTLPQDFTLFILMKEKSINKWKRKLDWIVEHGGLALLITHPDYMCFGHGRPCFDEYPIHLYAELLDHIRCTFRGAFWHVLPRELARFWATRHKTSMAESQ
jgi:peptidoglycan/xylan/chitin deacetylase (PgdA/CDA1 family)